MSFLPEAGSASFSSSHVGVEGKLKSLLEAQSGVARQDVSGQAVSRLTYVDIFDIPSKVLFLNKPFIIVTFRMV